MAADDRGPMRSVGGAYEHVLDRYYPRDPVTGERARSAPHPPVDFANVRKAKRPWWRFW